MTPRTSRMTGSATALVVAVAVTVVSAGCATTPREAIPRIDPRLHVGEMGTRSNFELREIIATTETLPAADASGRPIQDGPPRRAKKKKNVTVPVFWAGVILGIIGGAGTVAFGAGGLITEKQLTNSLYDSLGPEGDREVFTEEDYNTLNDRGELFNTLAVTSVVIGLVGMTMALAAFGHDYTHCGPLAPEKRQCEAAGYSPPAKKSGK